MLKNGSDIAGVNAQGRMQHTMRRWAQDEAKAIAKMAEHSDRTTDADHFAVRGTTKTAQGHGIEVAHRLNEHGTALLERRWSFVLRQCEKYGVAV